MKLCVTAFLVVSNVLLTDAWFTYNTTALTAEQEENVVNVLKVTADEESMGRPDYLQELMSALTEGIEKIAKTLVTMPGQLTTTVVRRTRLDLSKPLEFFVSTSYQGKDECIDGKKLKDKADDLKSEIERVAKESYPDLKFSVAVVGQGLAVWAIVLIVIAVLVVVGAAGFLVAHFRK